MIYIMTGPIGSGKTTQLENRTAGKKGIAGILMPVIAGERHLYSIHADKLVPVEICEGESSDEVVIIGKYTFSGKVFDWGNREIVTGFKKNKMIIIDEIGPLELNDGGFSPALKAILKDKQRLIEVDLILVIREGMVEQVLNNFRIREYKILKKLSDLE